MSYSSGWGEAAEAAFIKRYGVNGREDIVTMVARICRPSAKGTLEEVTPAERSAAERLLASCD
jgi:hypothetical protein